MRQTKTGEWERLHTDRETGKGPALAKRRQAGSKAAGMVPQDRPPTVRDVRRVYIEQHVEWNRKSQGVVEVKSRFDTMPGEFVDRPAGEMSRPMSNGTRSPLMMLRHR